MLNRITLEVPKSYASEENAVKAAEKKFGHTNLRYIVMMTKEGRFFPAFLGEPAISAGAHFHFHVIG